MFRTARAVFSLPGPSPPAWGVRRIPPGVLPPRSCARPLRKIALIQRYKADGEAALVKIDALIKGEVVPGHHDLTRDIDKLLAKVADAEEKMATLRRHYGTN